MITDLPSCGRTNWSDFPSGKVIVYFDVSSFVIVGPLGRLDAPKPFHVHVAFISRQQQPHRIAVRRSHALAVLVERDQRVIHCSLPSEYCDSCQRHRRLPPKSTLPSDRRRLPATGPRASRPSIRRTRPEPVNRLNPDRCGLLLVEQLAVTATFDEGDARLPRIARQAFRA